MIRRREFIALVGGAVAWPLAARAQQDTRIRRIGVLTGSAENEYQDRFTAFQQELQRLGWTDGHNIRIDYRRGVAGDPDRRRRAALELVSAAPDVILATGSPNVAMLQQATRTIPIIFVATADPVGAGFVASLARPAGNITGFTPFVCVMRHICPPSRNARKTIVSRRSRPAIR